MVHSAPAGLETRVEAPGPTSIESLDRCVARLREGAECFARLALEDRSSLARAMQVGYLEVAGESVAVACRAKGIRMGTPIEGEEWMGGPWPVVRHLRLVQESLRDLERRGNPRIGGLLRTDSGALAVRAFPEKTLDRLLFLGVTADVHLQEGVTEEDVEAGRAAFYKGQAHQGRVVLVLGAGNIASIPSMDVITKMFNEGKVCLLKMSPVNSYLGPLIERAFAAAIDRGFLAVAYGGAEEGAYLAQHEGIDEIHITGSDRTHDAIVWGPPGPDRDRRLAKNEPLLDKEISSELGNISPVIVVPGPFTARQIRFQAQEIACAMTANASFLCNGAKVLVLPRGWPGCEALLAALGNILGQVAPRRAYYPGAAERWRSLTEGRTAGAVRTIGEAGEGELPWTLIRDLDPDDGKEPLFRTEPFCPVLSEVAVGSDDPIELLDAAVDFVNTRLWGTLSATLVVHPTVARDPVTASAVERAIARLHYGTVGVNIFPAASYTLGTPPWGSYPGMPLADIQSGRGWVHNARMLEGIEKVVVRAPLTRFPKPPYFSSHRSGHVVGRRMLQLEDRYSWVEIPGLVAASLRS